VLTASTLSLSLCSHYQLGVDNVKFNVGEHFISGDPHPHMTLKTAGE